ncbi:hypothetical protein [Streptomyces platensis]|uniref:hypothetical protein n=1 Tax=Streptomyces platensis TaxID=58346 RepID=UPI0037B6B0A1
MADWSLLADTVDVRTLRQPFRSEDEVVAAIGDCEIIVAMRERTPFPASLLALPHLGHVTRRNYEAYFQQAVEDITAFLAGSPIRQLG